MSKGDWITKSEEQQIIRTYEGFKGEIIPYGEPNEHTYEITTVRKAGKQSLGLISIRPDFDPNSKEMPRIFVSHSDAKGKRVFIDVWDRDYDGKLYWRFRNPIDVPISDREKIRELETKVNQLEGRLMILQRKYQNVEPISGTESTPKPFGRPAHPEKLDEKAAKIQELIDKGLSEKEILEQLCIGRTTFYRLKRRIKD